MSSDVKTIFDPAEMESVGEKLGYGKDSKERLPWEHYLSQYQEAGFSASPLTAIASCTRPCH